MVSELRNRNSQAQQLYVSALSAAWRNGVQVYEASTWLARDPEAEDKMLRDADIAYAIGYRQALVAGRQWDLQPREKGSARGDLAVSIGTSLLSQVRKFTAARQILARAFFHGSRCARIHGATKLMTLGDGKQRWWWFPTRIEDLDKRTYRIVPKHDGKSIAAHWEHWDVAKAVWTSDTLHEAVHTIRHTYQDEQGTLGYGRGLREALGWWWYTKTNVFQDSVQAIERFAQGIVHAKVDGARDAASGLPNSELIDKWTDVLTNLRGRHVLVSDKSDEIEIVQGGGEGWQLLKDMREELRTAIVTLVLCANVTTAANSGGSYALGEVQENSTEALIQFDREALEETLTDDLLECVWWNNHANLLELGIVDDKPRFNIRQEKRLDPVQRAQVAQTLHGMGVALAADDLYEQTGFRKPEDGEDTIDGASAMPSLGGGLFGGSDPAGGSSSDSQPDSQPKPKAGE